MKALELRYTSENGGSFIFWHTNIGHEIGEQVKCAPDPKGDVKLMSIIGREENISEAGYNLILRLYHNHKGKISRNAKKRFEAKIRLAIHVMTIIGKLTPEDQDIAYQAYLNKLRAQRDARFMASMRRIEKIFATL